MLYPQPYRLRLTLKFYLSLARRLYNASNLSLVFSHDHNLYLQPHCEFIFLNNLLYRNVMIHIV